MKAAHLGIVLLGFTGASCAEGSATGGDAGVIGVAPTMSTTAPVSPPPGDSVDPSTDVAPTPPAPSSDDEDTPSSLDAGAEPSDRDATAPAPSLDASESESEDVDEQDAQPSDDDVVTEPPPPPPCGGECAEDEHCERATEMCVECLGDGHCGEDFVCEDNSCVAIIPCESSEQCEEDAPVCHSQLDRCVMCEIDLDCPETEVCDDNRCVDPAKQCLRGDDPCTASAISELPGEQVVDGFGDEFCEVPGFELSFANAARGGSDLPHTALVRVAWTENAFHLFAEVEDPELATNPNIESLWSGDAIELYLATSPASDLSGFFTGRVDGVQLVFAPPTEETPARAARLFWLPNEDNADSWHQVREEFTQDFAARVTADGYAIEARIPWSSFGPRAPELSSDSVIAFNLGLATANAGSIQNDAREGAAILFVGEPVEGATTCEGEQLPWCNATTWCSPTLQ